MIIYALMLLSNKTYSFRRQVKSAKLGRFVASALLIASVSTVSLQAGFVLNANAQYNPISAPISGPIAPSTPPKPSAPVTAPEVSPTPTATPSATPTATPTPTPSSNPITAPEVSPTPTPTPSATPSATPVPTPTATPLATPSATPTPTPNPVTAPEVTPTPSATPSATPTPTPVATSTPAPSASPYLKFIFPNGQQVFNMGDFVRVDWEQNGLDNYHCLLSYQSNVSNNPHLFVANPVQLYFNWVVDVSGLTPGNSAQVKMDMSCYDQSGHNGAFDRSDDFFTVNYALPTPIPTPTPEPTPSAAPTSEPSVEPSATPSATPVASSQPASNNNSNNGGGSNGGSNSGPSCNNEAPKATKIVSALTTNKNEVTLNWDKAQGPVTHYAVAYGLEKNKPLYGNPNVGNVTSYAVKGLSGGATYYFSVKGVNDCTAGSYSPEVAVKVGGNIVITPAQGFKPGVLGQAKASVAPSATPAPVVSENKPVNIGFIGKIVNFFKSLFN